MARHGKMLMLIALAVSLLALTLASAEQCGHQADNQKCPNNMCCSKHGYCGNTDEYCGEGCQSQCHGRGHGAYGVLAAAEQCGRQAGNQKCANDMCCSKHGYCGNTVEYCGEGCQSQCHGRGHGAYGVLAAAEQCGHQADNQKCPNNMCCSKHGYCGNTDEYCGEGCQSQCHGRGHGAYGVFAAAEQCGHQADNQKCPNNMCCSKHGYCGNTVEYCGEGCQSQCHSNGGLRTSTGKASYYSTYVPSACYGNDESHFPRNRHMAAVSDGNPDLWKNGQGCGKQYRIRCQGNGCRNGDAITIKVVDRCPNGCEGRVFDLSEEAFGAIADKNAGVIQVQYEPVNSVDAIPWAQKKLITEVGRTRK